MTRIPNKDDREIPLKGGNTNAEVVRVGKTVRRATSNNSPTIHRLLDHLEKKGATAVPRFHGIDEQGREILSYLDGRRATNVQLWQQETALVTSAKLLREFHDATLDFPTSTNDSWAQSYPDESRHEVICHNDFAPYNLLFSGGRTTAIIDFDLAGPGPRLRDFAYLAYWMVPLSFQSDDMKPYAIRDLENTSQRLKLICESYGIPCDRDLLDMVATVLTDIMASESVMIKTLGKETAQKLKSKGHLDHWQREADAYGKHIDELAANLD